MPNWSGLLAPAKTPPEVIAKINADLLTVFADADFKKRLHDQGLEPYPSTPEQFRTLIERDSNNSSRWSDASECKSTDHASPIDRDGGLRPRARYRPRRGASVPIMGVALAARLGA